MSEEYAKLTYASQYYGSTSNILKAVLIGKAAAGATLDTELEKETPEVRDQLRTIYSTEKRASHPLAAHPRIPSSMQNLVAHAVLKIGKIEADLAVLQAVRLQDPVMADYDRDYKGLERMVGGKPVSPE